MPKQIQKAKPKPKRDDDDGDDLRDKIAAAKRAAARKKEGK